MPKIMPTEWLRLAGLLSRLVVNVLIMLQHLPDWM